MKNKERDKIVLAALLHDIGKFYQRADDAGASRSKMLNRPIKELTEMYCPLVKNTFRGYKHVLWTAQFLADHEFFFKELIGVDYDRFFKAAVSHHRPDPNDFWQVLVQKADHYSSGADRTKEKGIQDAHSENKWDHFKNIRMVSIFEGIFKKDVQHAYQLPILSLQTNDAYFPQKTFTTKGQLDYAQLWTDFVKAFETIKETRPSLDAFTESLLSILGKYAVNIPSSTKHLPDVSLFDHLKSTACMADCLYGFLENPGELNNVSIKDEDTPILMIGGDLSGIQKYIYDIISKGAAKNLKGRSFYLHLLVDNIVRYLLRELGLSSVNIIYTSGGGFYLLAPNTERIVQDLTHITKNLEEKIFEVHREKLYLGITATPVTQAMIMQQEINLAWTKLMEKIGKTKREKFKNVLLSKYDQFFQPNEVGGKQRKDAITNEELNEEENKAANKAEYSRVIKTVEGEPVKLSTYQQIELGKKLREVKWWIVSHQKIMHWKYTPFEICDLGIYNYLLTDTDLAKTNGKLSVDNVFVNTFEIENLNLAPSYFKGGNNSYHFNFYGGNDFPKDDKGEPLTFDQLAATANGTQKLGILRMDIDNLGSIFAKGLGEQDRTFSKYSALSRNLDYFFKGYLNTIWQQEQFKNSTFIIYAGGDDLFVVGAWDSLIKMASTIQQKFKEWTCHNPYLSISGGIAIVSGKFPITKGAEMAESAEKLAKKHNYFSTEKAAFALLGKALNWEKELPLVTNIFQELVNHTRANTLPRGILHKLIQYAQIARYQEENNLSPKWRWHIAYDFSRAAKRTKDQSAIAFYDQIKLAAYSNIWKNESINPKYSFLDLLEVAARWAELATKN